MARAWGMTSLDEFLAEEHQAERLLILIASSPLSAFEWRRNAAEWNLGRKLTPDELAALESEVAA